MEFNSTEELIKDIKSGKMVILLDDEDRENEGDLVCAADTVTPEIINFMVKVVMTNYMEVLVKIVCMVQKEKI